MTTSNSSDPVSTGTEASTASVAETTAPEITGQTSQAAEISAASEGTKAKPIKEIDDLKGLAKKSAHPETANQQVSGAPGTEIPKPTFQPNWKYKAFGKEKEIDEMWRPLIKDAESEKKVKDIFTRVDAFDDIKQRYESTSQEFQGLLSEYQSLDKDVKKVMNFRNNRDFDNFFQSLRISDQEIFDWVSKKLDLNASPEAARMAQMQAQERERMYEMQQENQYLQQQYSSQATQARSMQLDTILSRTDVSSVASRYDERLGRIGAFRDLVIEEAQNYFHSTGGVKGGKDLSAEEAVQLVMGKFGKLLEGQPAAQAQVQTSQPQPQVKEKPVIPVVNGRGTSPVKKAPKSLDDLRSIYKEMTQGN